MQALQHESCEETRPEQAEKTNAAMTPDIDRCNTCHGQRQHGEQARTTMSAMAWTGSAFPDRASRTAMIANGIAQRASRSDHRAKRDSPMTGKR